MEPKLQGFWQDLSPPASGLIFLSCTDFHLVVTRQDALWPLVPLHPARVVGALCPSALCTFGSFFSFPS